MGVYMFGSGDLYVRQNGVLGAGFMKAGVVENVEFDFSATIVELRGQYEYAVIAAAKDKKLSWKGTVGTLDVGLFNEVYFGGTLTAGSAQYIGVQPIVIPTAAPYQLKITPPLSGVFVWDQCISFGANGLPTDGYTLGSTHVAPTSGEPVPTGHYYCDQATGTYTFSPDDGGAVATIDYLYQASAGDTLTITNNLAGSLPAFALMFNGMFRGAKATITLPNCVSSKLSMPFKSGDFVKTPLEGSVYAAPGGVVATIAIKGGQ